MLKIKFLFLFLISAALLFNTVNAQDKEFKPKKTPEERAAKISDKLKTELSLTDDQYNSVYNIFLEVHKQIDSDRQTYANDKHAFKKAAKERRQKVKESLNSVLNQEQISKLENFRKEKKNRPKKTPEERATLISERLKTELNLTDDQHTSVYNIFLDAQKQREIDKQTYGNDKEAFKKARKETNQKVRESMKSVLTQDQITKLKELRKQNKIKHKQYKKNKLNN
jgi:hypothetical protein